MKIEFHPEALLEYERAAAFFEAQQNGLGDRFFSAMESALESVAQNPARWPTMEADVRRRLARVFPYAVLYTVEPEYVLILAVMHCHGRPGFWRSRVMGQ